MATDNDIASTFNAFSTLQEKLADLQRQQKEALDAQREKLYETGIDFVYRGMGLGPYEHQIATSMAKLDRFGLRAGADNYIKSGATFMSRPHLNLSPFNIQTDRILNLLNNSNPESIQFAIRAMLDTEFARGPAAKKVMQCPYLDWRNPFFTWITNNLIEFSGGPTYQLDTYTDEGGYYGEDQSMALANNSYLKSFDLQMTVIDPYGGPIAASIFYWTYAIHSQYLGTILAYPTDIEQRLFNYTVSIYRFLLDFSGSYIQRAFKYTGCFPISRPGASLADFTREQPFVEGARSFSVGFKCAGRLDENDPIIYKEFNDLVERYYPIFKLFPRAPMDLDELDAVAGQYGLTRNLYLPDYNYTGIPYITTSSRGPRLDYFREKSEATTAAIIEKLNSVSQEIYTTNENYTAQIDAAIKNYYTQSASALGTVTSSLSTDLTFV